MVLKMHPSVSLDSGITNPKKIYPGLLMVNKLIKTTNRASKVHLILMLGFIITGE